MTPNSVTVSSHHQLHAPHPSLYSISHTPRSSHQTSHSHVSHSQCTSNNIISNKSSTTHHPSTFTQHYRHNEPSSQSVPIQQQQAQAQEQRSSLTSSQIL
jgi:hypothetical protein